jgi:hypothetical protein
MSRIAEAKKLIDKALAVLIEALEHGRSDALLAYLAFAGRFHKYSLRNQMLIYSQDPGATRVAGFHSWKSLGRRVRKGEHGLLIIVPMPSRRRDASLQQEDEIEIRFGTGYVFDVRQTEGDELPEQPTVEGDPGGFLERLHSLADSKSLTVTFRDFHPIFERGIQGLSKGGSIELANGLTPAEEFSVLSHELAHELLHKDAGARTLSKTILETEAEAVAHVVSSGIGLQSNGASSDYIALYDGDADTLRQSLNGIQRTAHTILAAILPQAS